MSDFPVTYKIDFPEKFTVLDADAQHSANCKGGFSCRVERGEDYATWIFGTEAARAHFIQMVNAFHHARPLTDKNSN